MLTNEIMLMIVVVGAILYVAYSCYLIHKRKHEIDEEQERKVATFILFILFFALAMIYQYSQHSCIFMVIWFGYALYLTVKETRKTLCTKRRRRTDTCLG